MMDGCEERGRRIAAERDRAYDDLERLEAEVERKETRIQELEGLLRECRADLDVMRTEHDKAYGDTLRLREALAKIVNMTNGEIIERPQTVREIAHRGLYA